MKRETNKKKEQPKSKQTRERLSLHGHNPEDAIRAFVQVPVKRVIKREQKQRDKRG